VAWSHWDGSQLVWLLARHSEDAELEMPELALNGFGSLRDSSSNFDPQKNFVFFVFFVEKNRTLISDLTQSNFKVLLTQK